MERSLNIIGTGVYIETQPEVLNIFVCRRVLAEMLKLVECWLRESHFLLQVVGKAELWAR